MWKHYPLDFHKEAPYAHLASMAAAEQGKFWEFHDKLFQDPQKLKADNVAQYAKELGLDMKKFDEDLLSPRLKTSLDADKAEAKALGVTGTPAFFINGRYLSGAKPFEEFAQVINAELRRLKLPVPEAAANVAAPAGG